MPNVRVETLKDSDLATLFSQTQTLLQNIKAEQERRAAEAKQAKAFATSPGRLASIAAALNLGTPQMPTTNGNGTHKAAAKKAVKAKGKKVAQRIPIHYRDPQNPSHTWSGRGKPAKWITEAIGQGRAKSVEDFRVKG